MSAPSPGSEAPPFVCFEEGTFGPETYYGFKDFSEPPRFATVSFVTSPQYRAFGAGPFTEWQYRALFQKSPGTDGLHVALETEGQAADHYIAADVTILGDYPLAERTLAYMLAGLVFARPGTVTTA